MLMLGRHQSYPIRSLGIGEASGRGSMEVERPPNLTFSPSCTMSTRTSFLHGETMCQVETISQAATKLSSFCLDLEEVPALVWFGLGAQ